MGDRNAIRKKLIRIFLKERAGTGKGALASRYVYIADIAHTTRRVLLKRPAGLNKGMDFTVHLEGFKFRSRGMVNMPTHGNVISALTDAKMKNPRKYAELSSAITAAYQCEAFRFTNPNFRANASSLSYEEIALAAKWLFIEQDVTYWNWSGRDMLYNALRDHSLC